MKPISVFRPLAIIIIASAFFACKKPDTTVTLSLAFSRKALEYVNPTEGKYLIYKDSASSLTDSVVVTKSKVSRLLYPESSNSITIPAHYQENFGLTLTKYTGTGYAEWLNANAELAFATLPFYTNDTSAVDLYEVAGGRIFYMRDTDMPSLSMVVEGRTFNNVVVMESDNGLAISNPIYKRTAFYWAKGIGIIKRRTITTGGAVKTYNLLRNN